MSHANESLGCGHRTRLRGPSNVSGCVGLEDDMKLSAPGDARFIVSGCLWGSQASTWRNRPVSLWCMVGKAVFYEWGHGSQYAPQHP